VTHILVQLVSFALLLAQATGARPSAAELNAMRAETKALIDCWYRQTDERCFWSKWLPNSPLNNPQQWAEAYAGAFVGKPNPATLEIGIERLSGVDPIEVLNADPKADGFYVISGLPYLEHEFSPTELAEARRAGIIPATEDLLVALYWVEGEGYRAEGMALLWVKDGAVWRLCWLRGFD
jgi:hypothetical protein